MDHKITLNEKEYDIRDFTPEQHNLLAVIQIADPDIRKMSARLAVMQEGREQAVKALVASVEATAVEKGEADD